ncbi:unnamed protein product [Lactuca virosa]|uniref:Uncharacterized protein n=1 Tax=Lactuca virosa TaxID=75947 RepID=A0AAU9MY90_9ASTR|nr:unnamed protein product [Lactuca virosa]
MEELVRNRSGDGFSKNVGDENKRLWHYKGWVGVVWRKIRCYKGSWNAKWMIQRIKCSKCLYLGIDDERQDVFTTVNGLQKLKHNDLSKS